MTEQEQYTLVANNGTTYEINKEQLSISVVIADMIADNDDKEIPLSNIDQETLAKVVEFLKYFNEKPFNFSNPEDLPEDDRSRLLTEKGDIVRSSNLGDYVPQWYCDYTNIELPLLEKIMVAADNLNIQQLLHLCAVKYATLLEGIDKKNLQEELKRILSLPDDFKCDPKDLKW